MKVLILGASGFVGRHLRAALERRGDVVIAGSLHDPSAAATEAAACDAVVNLAGEPIAQRWNDAVKRAILSSRTELPRRFLEALERRDHSTLKTYVSASAVGYYGTSETSTFTEESPPGADFLAQVCEAWERQADAARGLGMRVAIVRSGLVLGRDGGALAKMLPPFRFGAGGIVGNGKQWYSWVHIDDVAAIYVSAIDGGDGPFNATAPNPVTNAEFTHALAAVLHRPTVLPVPQFVLEFMLGEGASVLTGGQRVLSRRITGERGYTFAFPVLAGALENLLA